MADISDEQRAALKMLAASRGGCSVTTAVMRGFAFEALEDLVRAGLATAHRVAVGAGKTKSVHLRITAAGGKAIAE
jgi:hypothetical protein